MRVCCYIYGICIIVDFDEKYYILDKKIYIGGKMFVRDIFNIYIKVNEIVYIG